MAFETTSFEATELTQPAKERPIRKISKVAEKVIGLFRKETSATRNKRVVEGITGRRLVISPYGREGTVIFEVKDRVENSQPPIGDKEP